MHRKYEHILSPFKIGNTFFRNRLLSAPHGIHALQGVEPYPSDGIMASYANTAKGGAAMVTIHGIRPYPIIPDDAHLDYDIRNFYTQRYLAQLAEIIRFYGAKASMEIMDTNDLYKNERYDVTAGIVFKGKSSLEMTEDIMNEMADAYANQASILQYIGYDMVMIHLGYRGCAAARFLSPVTNKRTDKYGGSIENRARYPIMIFDRIKQKCGKDFLIELRMSATEPEPDGMKIEDSIILAKLLEGHIDLLQVHSGEMRITHPLCFHPPTPHLALAEAIKKGGTNLPIVTIGSYQDLDEAEEVIASGKADFISMARGWIADPNLGNKAYEGRGEDVVPCIKCMRCHSSACIENRTYVCSVNPVIGLEHKIEKIIQPAMVKKKVAVVGGGPGGMQAALTAAERGHEVILYEKKGFLGGQLNFSEKVSFKYSLNKYRKYLIRQIEKSKVEVRLNTEVNASLIKAEGFDVVIAALGADPIIPPIPGIDGKNVVMAPLVYGNENNLSSRIVVIGGGQVGCETGLHLAMSGHKVILIEMCDKLAHDASMLYREELIYQMEKNDNLEYILNACCVGMDEKVYYTDSAGAVHDIEAGTVVIATGMKPKIDEAMALYDTGDRFVMLGDCSIPGNVEKAIRSAYAAAIVV